MGDASLADDVVSDVFVDVWRNATTFRAQSKASTWLYSMARHKALTALRRRSVHTLDDELAAEIGVVPSLEPLRFYGQ
jgi:RNA polymerase sigma-70 factor (ECF subfamily)